ncbi:MAG: DUF3187 family protein [bacterium]|nr:DUF3187 family protein [bacterium]MDT8366620.1 DUF3187 family protein [bacterium]
MNRGFRLRLLLFSLFVASLVVAPPCGFAHEDSGDRSHDPGFLHIRPQAPAYSFRMTMPHLLPGSIKPGVGYVLGTTLSSIWVNNSDLILDYEMLDFHLSLTYGFNEDFGFALVYDQRDYLGGILDGLTEGFHDLFNIDQNGRTDVPRGRTYFKRFDTGEVIENFTVLDNKAISLLVQYVFLHGKGSLPAAGISGGVRYALEAPDGGTKEHPLDVNITLGLAKRLSENWYSCLHLGLTRFEQTKVLNLDFKEEVFTGMVALAWEISHRYSLLAQVFHSEGTIKDFAQFDESSTEFDLGMKVVTDSGGAFEFAIIENVLIQNNSPDIGFHFGYSKNI